MPELCPVRKITTAVHGEAFEKFLPCEKENCMLYVAGRRVCVFMDISDSLTEILNLGLPVRQ